MRKRVNIYITPCYNEHIHINIVILIQTFKGEMRDQAIMMVFQPSLKFFFLYKRVLLKYVF